jgi:hypothetical protein
MVWSREPPLAAVGATDVVVAVMALQRGVGLFDAVVVQPVGFG